MAGPSWDVFVSYARADDQPPRGTVTGWVTTLAAELRKVLRRKLGVRAARIFMDHQLAGNEGVTNGLLDAVRASRTLLLLMSPGYQRSYWCQWELGQFLEAQIERNHRDHVFVLEMEPMDRAGWHPALQELIPIRFWHREFEDKAPRLMGFPVPKLDEDNPYWRNLNELAHLIARQLEDAEVPPREPRARVWLAEPTEDLLDEQESVAATLRQQGFLVVPAARLPRDGREPYLRVLQDGLEQAVLGVQLLGLREGHCPTWGDHSFVALQAAAADEAARARGLRVLRWRSRDVDLDRVTSAHYRALLTGEGVLAQGLEEFKQEILRALDGRTKTAAPGASPDSSRSVDVPYVSANVEAVDRDLGRRVSVREPRRLDLREVKAPYPGLRPFASYEAEIFFGREAHTDRLLEILQCERFLAVLGPSGAGKSSLVRAGLLPALTAGWLGGASDWRIAVLHPGERPIRRLAEELVQTGVLGSSDSAPTGLPGVEAELRRGPLGLAHLVADARRGAAEAHPFKLLVLVDQFEEIFRYAQAGGAAADESEAFVNLLLASRAAPDAGVYVALTMRTDFLGHCVRFLELPEAINRAQYLTPRPTRAELERAITGPALVFGGDVAPELVTGLINSLDQDFDQLPLLQHALARMWITAPAQAGGARLLTATSLDALGGLQGALSAHAEEVFGKLSAGEQVLAETLFRCITLREGDGLDARSTRRPQRLEQIAAVVGCDWRDLEPVVRAFAVEGVNFLHHGEPLGPESVIDISHEALIRQWERLRVWADDEALRAAEARRWRDRAVLRRQGGELLAGADLARAVEWRDDETGRRPTVGWAARYLDSEGEVGFDETLAFTAESEAAEAARREQEILQAKAQEQLERSALEARAEAERTKAEAAARERDQAQEHSRRSSRLSRVALATAVLALISTGVALTFYREAKEAAKEALVRQLANEATFRADVEPDRAQLLAVAAFKTRDRPISNVAVRQAYVRSESMLRTFQGHEGRVYSAVFSPGGRTVLTASEDHTARLWDAGTGRTLQIFRGHEDDVSSAVFSADGRTVLTASDDLTARLWDAGTGGLLQAFRGHEGGILSAVFSADGRIVLTASEDQTARLWDAATGRPLQILRGHEREVVSAVFSPDELTILTASKDQTARLWDAGTGRPLQTLRGHEDEVVSAVFSPDGRTVLTASWDKTARLWDAGTGRPLQIFRGHERSVFSAVFSPDGSAVLTASGDHTARLWDAGTGRPFRTLLGHERGVLGAIFSADGRTVLTISETMRLWDGGTSGPREILQGHEGGSLYRAVFSADGRTILTAGWDKTARLWNVGTGRPQILRGHEGPVVRAVFSADGRTVLTASEDQTARLWDTGTGRPLQTLRGHEDKVISAVFSPDDRTVLTVSKDQTARLWDASTGRPLQVLRGDEARIVSAVFSPDGRTVLTASWDQTARLWDARLWDAVTGQSLQIFRGHEDRVDSAVFSPDGRTVLTASWDRTARLWDAGTGRPLQILRHEAQVFRAVFSPDSRTVLTVSRGQTARLWDAGTGRPLQTLRGHKGFVNSAAFSPDGHTILTAGDDQTARLWDTATGRPLQTFRGLAGWGLSAVFSPDMRTVLTASEAQLWDAGSGRFLEIFRGHARTVTSAVFSPDGRTVLTASWDKTARLWPCNACRPTQELADEILRRVGRHLTPEERAESGLPPLPETGLPGR